MSKPCRECGCTDDRACEGGCFWVMPELCSRCVLNALAATGSRLDPEPRQQLAGELLCLVESIDPGTFDALSDGGATAGFASSDGGFDEPRLWRPGDP